MSIQQNESESDHYQFPHQLRSPNLNPNPIPHFQLLNHHYGDDERVAIAINNTSNRAIETNPQPETAAGHVKPAAIRRQREMGTKSGGGGGEGEIIQEQSAAVTTESEYHLQNSGGGVFGSDGFGKKMKQRRCGIGDLQDWEAAMKFQRMNGSLFNSPSATTAALIHLRGDAGSLRYLRSVLGTSDGNNVPDEQFLTENTDFTVVGVIGPPGVGKSTIMNELYGFDGTSPGMLPPFNVQSEDNRIMARHCTVGIEPRISSERVILLDTQPVFSPSILTEMMKPDGSSIIPVLNGENLSAELAHELMCIQVDLLKHGIPDPSSVSSVSSSSGAERDSKDKGFEEEYIATPIFVHTKVQDEDCTQHNYLQLRKTLTQYLGSSSFTREKSGSMAKVQALGSETTEAESGTQLLKLHLMTKNESPRAQSESQLSLLWKLRDEVLSMNCPSFARTVSEREWLKNSAKIWEMVKSSGVIAEYSRMLQGSGLFRSR
ncbi:Nonsense-mediated mRNA decay factor SMG9 [Linum perenne]